jgi:hypothetical protein
MYLPPIKLIQLIFYIRVIPHLHVLAAGHFGIGVGYCSWHGQCTAFGYYAIVVFVGSCCLNFDLKEINDYWIPKQMLPIRLYRDYIILILKKY